MHRMDSNTKNMSYLERRTSQKFITSGRLSLLTGIALIALAGYLLHSYKDYLPTKHYEDTFVTLPNGGRVFLGSNNELLGNFSSHIKGLNIMSAGCACLGMGIAFIVGSFVSSQKSKSTEEKKKKMIDSSTLIGFATLLLSLAVTAVIYCAIFDSTKGLLRSRAPSTITLFDSKNRWNDLPIHGIEKWDPALPHWAQQGTKNPLFFIDDIYMKKIGLGFFSLVFGALGGATLTMARVKSMGYLESRRLKTVPSQTYDYIPIGD